MRVIIPFVLLLFLLSCERSQPDEVSLKYVPIKQGEYWGYIDQSGKIVIAPQFKEAFTFSEGLALVMSSDGKYGFVNEKGQYKVQPFYREAGGFSEGLANVVKENQRIEYIDKNGSAKLTLEGGIEYGFPFRQDRALIRKDNKYGYIDRSGKIVIPAQYEEASHFFEGLARIAVADKDKDAQYGYINKEGKLVINPQFERAGDFRDGMAMIRAGEKYGFINKEGKIAITPQYDEVGRFFDGLAPAQQGDLWGFIDKEGKWKINPQFKAAEEFNSSGTAPVKPATGDKWGFINKKGEMIIEAQFESATPFYDGVSITELNEKYGLVDSKGKYQVNPQYEKFSLYNGSYTPVQSDYFDVSSMSGLIFNKYSATSFKNISKGANFKTLQKEFPGLTHDNHTHFDPPQEDENQFLRLKSIAVYFDKDEFYTYDGYNDDTPLQAAVFTYSLKDKARDKKDEILNLLRNSVPTVMTKEYREGKYILLYTPNYFITMITDNNDLLVALTFSREKALPKHLVEPEEMQPADTTMTMDSVMH